MSGTGTRVPEQDVDAWRGGLLFAAVLLIVVGVLDVLRGIMAIGSDDIFIAAPQYTFEFTLAAWGWIHLLLGVVAVVVGAGIARGMDWARTAGIVIAGLLLIASFLSLPYHPLWSLILIFLYAAALWALAKPEPLPR